MSSRRPGLSPLVDGLVAGGLSLAGLAAYVSTLAPTLLDGDAALFQYAPARLAVTYPTGYPSYMLIGNLWANLVPLGTLAYRMNLLSAVLGGLALGFLYLTLLRLYQGLVESAGQRQAAAIAATLIFASLPTYWRWASEAKIYTLHIFLLSTVFYLLSRLMQVAPAGQGASGTGQVSASAGRFSPALAAAILLFSLALGNHSTTLLLAPGLVLFYWLNCRVGGRHLADIRPGRVLRYLPFALPVLLYLYVPLRAGWWLAELGEHPGLTVPVAVARGLVSEYYHPGISGLIRYFSAADFTHGVWTNWGLVPQQLVDVYWPLVRADFTLWGAILGGVGALYFAVLRPRRFWPLFLNYLVLIPFVLTYGQGEQSAFLLPSSLMLSIFAGAAVAGGLRLIARLGDTQAIRQRPAGHWPRRLGAVLLELGWLTAVVYLPVQQARQNVDWLTTKWSDATYRYWSEALAHPLEQGAGILAHWGDLTSMWYLQHVEGVRPDLYGLYPPTPEVVDSWLRAGHALYVAGPLQGWEENWAGRYQFLPWGRLVRLAERSQDGLSLLPDLPTLPGNILFGDRLQLLMADFAPQTPSGGALPVTLVWRAHASLTADTRLSLRLVDERGELAAQADDTLLSGWLPSRTLPAGQVMLTFHRFKVPAGSLPGSYRLQLALSEPGRGAWPLANGQPVFELGVAQIVPADLAAPPDPWGEYKPVSRATFGDEIRLVGYDYSVTRARQGRGFAARLLWQALRPPAADYTLEVALVDATGHARRTWQHVPTDGRLPTSRWSAGQLVRDRVNLVLPADAPPGDDSLRLSLAWLRPDGTRLPLRATWWPAWLPWLFSAGDSLSLPGVRVVEQEGRSFDLPSFAYAVNANFDDQIELVGFDLPLRRLRPGETLPLTLVWRSRSSDIRVSYTVFAHLVGPDGRIYGQQDKAPGLRGKQPTTSWVAGEVVTDPVEIKLAPDAPPGSYQLRVGLYLAESGARLPLRDVSGAPAGDALDLATITVSTP